AHLRAADARRVTGRAKAGPLIKARRPGAPVQLTILRHGRTEHVRLATANAQGTPEIGVQLVESYVFPFPVTITIGNIGGPSAGLMFALGIIDKITPDHPTGGRVIAGTRGDQGDGAPGPTGR